ncbi:hypothetical protein BDN70DRAFT_870981 [Pholiota conissans]|uniref:Uncharacterized protein n=1 Tax=Pholiota conissans TaxID=109636 RepID=A0A9P5ZFE9_9AGAR|nr:hypothetical protein BDN70DRAFT_870981 [Pholiota conissans]
MKFSLPLWFLPLFFGYWASIVLAYPVVTQPAPGSLAIRDSIELSDAQFSRSLTGLDDLEDLEARGKFVQKFKDFHQKYISRGPKSHTKKPLQVHVKVERESTVHYPTHFDRIAGKKLPPLPRPEAVAPTPPRYQRPGQHPLGPRPRPDTQAEHVRPRRRPLGPRPKVQN